jgi:ABC-type Fe3+/spermidine/putrescine transport system ATPase subunit
MSNVLEAKNISVAFGGLLAVNSVDFDIPKQKVVSLIGPNGAGKTTFFNVLTGLYKPSAGTISYEGKDITDLPPHKEILLSSHQALWPDDCSGESPCCDALEVEVRDHLHDPSHAKTAPRRKRG